MKTFYIYECDSAICRGEQYATTEHPLSCPYCDQIAIGEEPFKILEMSKFKDKQIKGKEIAKLIEEWCNKNRLHSDDLGMMFAEELLQKLEEDE